MVMMMMMMQTVLMFFSQWLMHSYYELEFTVLPYDSWPLRTSPIKVIQVQKSWCRSIVHKWFPIRSPFWVQQRISYFRDRLFYIKEILHGRNSDD